MAPDAAAAGLAGGQFDGGGVVARATSEDQARYMPSMVNMVLYYYYIL